MMSDKALVKHLQKEVARLESELKTPGSICDHGPLLRKKDIQIEKVLTIFSGNNIPLWSSLICSQRSSTTSFI